MHFFKNIGILFYRIWFYFLMFSYILVCFPLLVISILKEEWYPMFFKLARGWAIFILFGMAFRPVIRRETLYKSKQSYMFIANHTSMTDIMLMLYAVKNPFVFVGKKELEKIPLFGFFYKRSCILVDRSNKESRRAVYDSAQRKINLGYSICIFPEGGVPDDESIVLDDFKDGAFRLAIEHKIPIAPLTFHDNKKLFSYTFFSGGPGKMRAVAHNTIPTNMFKLEEKQVLQLQCHDIILKELLCPTIKLKNRSMA